MTIRLQTNGISLVTPKITVFDRAGRTLATRTSTSDGSDVIAVRLQSVVPDARYYVRVEAAPGSTHPVGRYGVAVVFDGLLGPLAISLDAVMRGRYEHLEPEKVDALFKDPNSLIAEDDAHLDDTPNGAIALRAGLANPSEFDLSADGSLSDSTDVDFYRVRTPDSNGTWVMTVTLRAIGANAILPQAQVLFGNLTPVPSTIVANGNRTFTIQSTDVAANRSLFVRIASPNASVGNYSLNVQFGTVPAELNNFLSGTTQSAGQALTGNLYIAQTQLMNFVLSAGGTNGVLTMVIRDSLGNIVQQLNVRGGNTASSISRILAPGQYSFSFTSNIAMPFTLRGSRITDPIGPIIDDGTLDPQYPSDQTDVFLFPDGTLTAIPYLWLFDFL